MLKLSIIVPVYNVEAYIHACLDSVFGQGLDDAEFEVILVNDGTQDDSFGKIQDVQEKHPNIVVVEQTNQGLSAARNTGMRHAKGEYILYLDSDDLLVTGSLAPLLEKAYDNKADLAVADFVKLNDEEILRYGRAESLQYPIQVKTGRQLFLEDLNPSQNYVWRTLYRRAFLKANDIRFIPGICYEDMPFTPECYLKADRCIRAYWDLYLYRVGRQDSITASMTVKKALDMNMGIARIWELKSLEGLSSQEHRRLMDNLFATFSFLLWCVSHNPHVFSHRHEIVRDLRQRIPDLWFSHGIKQFVVSLMFRLIPDVYLKLRSL